LPAGERVTDAYSNAYSNTDTNGNTDAITDAGLSGDHIQSKSSYSRW
jgi:hypothetical protein